MRLRRRTHLPARQAGGENHPPAFVPAGILFLVAGAAFPPLASGIVAGLVAGCVLRVKRWHWSWGLAGALLSVCLLLVWGQGGVNALLGLRRAFLTAGGVLLLTPHWSVLAQRWPVMVAWSLPVCGLCASAVKAYYDRCDRIGGGRGGREVAATPTPIAVARHVILRLRDPSPSAATERGVRLGRDPRGVPVRLPWESFARHELVLGASRQGKTTSALAITAGTLAAGWGQIILDLRGDPQLAERARLLAKLYDRPFWYWSVDDPPWPGLAASRCACNFLHHGTLTDRRDLLFRPEQEHAALESQAGPLHTLRLALDLLELCGDVPTLDKVNELLDPEALAARLQASDDQRYRDDLDWLASLGPSDQAAIGWLRRRIGSYLLSPAGSALVPAAGISVLDLEQPLTSGGVAVFSIDTRGFADLGHVVASYALQSISAVCGSLQRAARTVEARLVIDEATLLDANQLGQLLDRSEAVGLRVSVVAPSVATLSSAGGNQLVQAIFEKCGHVLTHRQNAADAGDLVAELHANYHGAARGGEQSTTRTRGGRRRWWPRAQAEAEPNFAPDDIGSLARGEAAVWRRDPLPWSGVIHVDRPPSTEALKRAAGEEAIPRPAQARGRLRV